MATKWIPLLVPESHYLEIAELVRARVQESDEITVDNLVFVPTGTDDGGDSPGDDLSPKAVAARALREALTWDVDDLRRLAVGEIKTTERWAKAMDFCAQQPGEFFSTRDVVEGTGMTLAEWRDAPRKISRHLASHYPNVDGAWPLAVVSGRKLGHTYDQAYWAITEEQAEVWKKVRGTK